MQHTHLLDVDSRAAAGAVRTSRREPLLASDPVFSWIEAVEQYEEVLASGDSDAVVQGFARTGLAPYLDRWRARDLLAGRPIEVLHPDGRRASGLARGVDDDGALRVDFDDGRRDRLIGGEVSVRRR